MTDSIDAGQQGGQRHHPQCTGKGRGGTPPVIGILTLAWPAMDLPIAFGTDDLGFSSPGDLALLALGMGGNPVGQAITVMHRNALINQTPKIPRVLCDEAPFPDMDPTLHHLSVMTGVDDMTGNVKPVPEPASMLRFGSGRLPDRPASAKARIRSSHLS